MRLSYNMLMANILIIDDDARILDYVSKLLGQLGHHAVTAQNGATGFHAAEAPDVNLIISDICMPGPISGMPYIRKLREMRRDIPLVVITGNPSSDNIEECRSMGISEFLAKPFEIAFLKSVVNRLLSPPATRAPA